MDNTAILKDSFSSTITSSCSYIINGNTITLTFGTAINNLIVSPGGGSYNIYLNLLSLNLATTFDPTGAGTTWVMESSGSSGSSRS